MGCNSLCNVNDVLTGALKSPRPDDTAYDIITDEEVNCVHDSNSLYYTAVQPSETQQL